RGPGPVIATRINENSAQRLISEFPLARYYQTARLVVAKPQTPALSDPICIITAGTADLSVAEEAAITAEALGARIRRLFDVGVAGLHRLMKHRRLITKAKAIVVCAGMEGALASVVGGLASCPVI